MQKRQGQVRVDRDIPLKQRLEAQRPSTLAIVQTHVFKLGDLASDGVSRFVQSRPPRARPSSWAFARSGPADPYGEGIRGRLDINAAFGATDHKRSRPDGLEGIAQLAPGGADVIRLIAHTHEIIQGAIEDGLGQASTIVGHRKRMSVTVTVIWGATQATSQASSALSDQLLRERQCHRSIPSCMRNSFSVKNSIIRDVLKAVRWRAGPRGAGRAVATVATIQHPSRVGEEAKRHPWNCTRVVYK